MEYYFYKFLTGAISLNPILVHYRKHYCILNTHYKMYLIATIAINIRNF